jgi:hypothetical protein
MAIDELVRDAWNNLGESQCRTLVLSFELRYGLNSHQSRIARMALYSLTEEAYSPSQESAAVFASAPVAIPNSRRSDEPRRKGRSVD